jgi:hypothetical protein
LLQRTKIFEFKTIAIQILILSQNFEARPRLYDTYRCGELIPIMSMELLVKKVEEFK